MFLKNRKHKKLISVIWTLTGILVIGSMLLMYLPAFL